MPDDVYIRETLSSPILKLEAFSPIGFKRQRARATLLLMNVKLRPKAQIAAITRADELPSAKPTFEPLNFSVGQTTIVHAVHPKCETFHYIQLRNCNRATRFPFA